MQDDSFKNSKHSLLVFITTKIVKCKCFQKIIFFLHNNIYCIIVITIKYFENKIYIAHNNLINLLQNRIHL